MKKISAYEVALSALSCALATVFLVVGTITPILLFTAYMVSCVALMLPLTKQFYLGYFLAYIATVLLSILFCGAAFLVDLLPFALFFGLHPLMNELQMKWGMNKWLAFFIKVVWFDGALAFICWFMLELTAASTVLGAYAIPIVLIVGAVYFFFYDYAMFRIRTKIEILVKRIHKN